MAEFHRVVISDDNFIRGAARIMWAGITITFPTDPSTIINLSSYDAQTGWNDMGATKTGITITHNNTEEEFDVDQILTAIDTRPVGYEQSVTTALAQADVEHLQLAWEGGPITTASGFKKMGVGEPPIYIKRRLAVLFKKANDKLRVHAFRIVTKAPQESALAFNKTGEQQTIPVRFRALADTSIVDVYERTQLIWDQV